MGSLLTLRDCSSMAGLSGFLDMGASGKDGCRGGSFVPHIPQ
jgi:hypothetical protein